MPTLGGRKTPRKQEPDHSNIINILALTLAMVAILSFLALALLRFKNPGADVGIFLNICLTSLGYIAGIITGLLGVRERQISR